jgi:hypothetical protein
MFNGAQVGSFDQFSNFHAPGGVTANGAIKLADNIPITFDTTGAVQQRWNGTALRLETVINGGVQSWVDGGANGSFGGVLTVGTLVSPHVIGGNGSTITYAGAAQSGNTSFALSSNANIAGSLTAGSITPNSIVINSDTASVAVAPNGVNWFSVEGNFGGTGTQGCRTGVYSYLNMNDVVAGANDSFKQFNGILGTFQASASAGGTALTSGNTAGFGYGGSDQSWLLSGATFWSGIIGRETDVGIATGASAAQRTGIQVVSFRDVQGSYEDSAFKIGRGPSSAGGNNKAPGFKIGVALSGWWPIDPAGAILQMLPPRPGGLSGLSMTAQTPTAALGIDLSGVSFTSAAFRSTGGFVVDGAGMVGVGGGKLSSTGSILAVDATGSIVSAVPSVTGTTPVGYVVNDVVWEPISGTVVTVNTVNGTGAPLTWTVTHAGGVTGSTFATAAFLGGTGSGITFNLTWTATTGLSLNPTGQHIGFNGTAPVAKPTVTGSKGANAALTSLMTALSSLGLVTDSTT